jgi:hypothetical protein
MISSLEGDIVSFSHILISISREGYEMFIDRAFSEIASSWIGYLESSESREEGREEEYPYSYFFDLLAVESGDRHLRRIELHCTAFPYDCHSE